MRITSTQAVSRPAYIDRNPVVRTVSFASVLAPHATTSRGSYTVPAGKKAFIEVLAGRIMRATVAAPVAIATITFNYTPSGGAAISVDFLTLATNAIGDHENARLAQYGGLLAGDKIEAFTGDTSTGGSVEYDLSVKIFEYDA